MTATDVLIMLTELLEISDEPDFTIVYPQGTYAPTCLNICFEDGRSFNVQVKENNNRLLKYYLLNV